MGKPPFIYDHPSKFSFDRPSDKAWDPKAITRASWVASLPSPPKPRQEGPLIDAKEFNRHPDSYFVVPYGNLHSQPMSPRTKDKVKYLRWAQLLLRICGFLDALGLLFCVICIKGTQGSTGWIIRVPAGVAILHTIYAIYHLARSPNARTPGSSGSYMIFSALIDAGLIPFFTFTAIIAHSQYIEPSDTPGRWTSLFMFDTASTKIIYATYLVSVVGGSLHVVSLLIAVYLAIIFRKISKLPPDMNPLEDNLTSRHKRNKSELLESRNDRSTIDTDAIRDRGSRAEDPLISPVRTVPFMHTRNESSVNLNNVPHPHFSPRLPRTNMLNSPTNQSFSMRSACMNSHQESFSDHPENQELFQTKPMLSKNGEELPSSQTKMTRSPTKSSSVYTDDVSRPASTRPSSTRSSSTRPRSAAPSLQDTNWITYPAPTPSPPLEFKHLRTNNTYQPVSQFSLYDEMENFVPRPLEMNPPTPPNMQRPPATTERRIVDHRALTPGTGNTLGMGFNHTNPLSFQPPQRRQQQYRDGYSDLGGTGNRKIRNDVGYGGQRSGRIVSRSGIEVRPDEWMGSGVRARDVSGKVAEEGRGSEHGG